MTLTVGYLELRSKDNVYMVQVFTDLSTGSISLARIMKRNTSGLWEPLSEVAKAS